MNVWILKRDKYLVSSSLHGEYLKVNSQCLKKEEKTLNNLKINNFSRICQRSDLGQIKDPEIWKQVITDIPS